MTRKEPEAVVEKHLRSEVNRLGGLCFKFTSPGSLGVPDRVVIFQGRTYFLELKGSGGKTSKLQEHWINRINKQGVSASVLSSRSEVDEWIQVMLRHFEYDKQLRRIERGML